MNELVWLLVGLMIGGCIATAVLCCLQINRINYYEQEIRRLKDELEFKTLLNIRE